MPWVGLELEVRLLPSLGPGLFGLRDVEDTVSVQVRAGALGEGRLDVPQVSKGGLP